MTSPPRTPQPLTAEQLAEIPFGHRSALKGAIANTLAENRDSADAASLIARAVNDTLVELGYAELAAVRAERDELATELEGANLARWEEEQDVRRARAAAANARKRAASLRAERDEARVAGDRWRKRARVAEAMVYELRRPAIEKDRNEVRSSMTALAAEAEQERDHEGAAALQAELEKHEAKWRRTDEGMQARIGADFKNEEASR